jgi:hypothetical protein
VRPLDEAVLTIRETPPPPDTSPRPRTPDDIRDVCQHVPRRQKIVPFVTGPAKQNRPNRQRTGDPAHEKGTYSAYGAFSALLFGPPSPHHPQKPGSKTSRLDTSFVRSPKTSHPRRQDGQINYLDILAIFVKQTTYLATLPLFGHLALATLLLFGHLAQSLPRVKEIPRRRNVTSSVRRRFAHDLVSLLRFLRTFLQATQPRQPR